MNFQAYCFKCEKRVAALTVLNEAEFWAVVYTKHAMERAAHILDLIEAKWPTIENLAVSKKGV